MPGAKRRRVSVSTSSKVDREPSSSLSPPPASSVAASSSASPHKAKKRKLVADFTGISPYPDFLHPTPSEAHDVHALLAQHDPKNGQARTIPAPDDTSNAAATCGAVANVLDSLIGTILSQNTSAANSSSAKRSLDAAFGTHGFAALAHAPRADVEDAIRRGGLAARKAKTIQTLLAEVCARHGAYSLQHLAEDPAVSDAQIMGELVSYDGVGPKTAACVLLFCLGRDAFAVDTHVYRLTRLLGWVPARADRVQAQMHLDVRVPKELKYGLHVMMVRHGRTCKGCKGAGTKGGECILKGYLQQRKGKAKGDVEAKAEEAEIEAEKVAV